MGVGGAPPVAEGSVIRSGVEETVEVASHLVEQFLFRVSNGQVSQPFRRLLGEIIEPDAGGLISGAFPAIRGMLRQSGSPDFIRVPDVVSGFFQYQGVARYAFVPPCARENRSQARLPEVPPRQYRASARGAAWSGNMRVEEECAFSGNSVEVGRVYQLVDCALAGLSPVGAGISAPVVRECENYVWSHDFPPRCSSYFILSARIEDLIHSSSARS